MPVAEKDFQADQAVFKWFQDSGWNSEGAQSGRKRSQAEGKPNRWTRFGAWQSRLETGRYEEFIQPEDDAPGQ